MRRSSRLAAKAAIPVSCFERVSNEVVIMILANLKCPDLLSTSMVSKRFYQLSRPQILQDLDMMSDQAVSLFTRGRELSSPSALSERDLRAIKVVRLGQEVSATMKGTLIKLLSGTSLRLLSLDLSFCACTTCQDNDYKHVLETLQSSKIQCRELEVYTPNVRAVLPIIETQAPWLEELHILGFGNSRVPEGVVDAATTDQPAPISVLPRLNRLNLFCLDSHFADAQGLPSFLQSIAPGLSHFMHVCLDPFDFRIRKSGDNLHQMEAYRLCNFKALKNLVYLLGSVSGCQFILQSAKELEKIHACGLRGERGPLMRYLPRTIQSIKCDSLSLADEPPLTLYRLAMDLLYLVNIERLMYREGDVPSDDERKQADQAHWRFRFVANTGLWRFRQADFFEARNGDMI